MPSGVRRKAQSKSRRSTTRKQGGVASQAAPNGRANTLNVSPSAPSLGSKLKRRPITTGGSERTRTDAAKMPITPSKQKQGGIELKAPNVKRHKGQSPLEVDGYVNYADEQGESIEIDQRNPRKPYSNSDDEYDTDSLGEVKDSQDEDWNYFEAAQSGENIAEYLTSQQLSALAQDVMRDHDIDEESRKDCVQAYDKAMEMVRAKPELKTYPFQNAANVKYPLLATASLQFAARAYPAIVKGVEVVKARVVGKDDEAGTKAARAARISEHMSFQLTEEQPEWEKQMDELLHHLPLAGTAFRCVYYDDELGRNTTELVNMKDFVVNNDAKSLKDCPRYTRLREYYPYEIKAKMRNGFYTKHENLFGDVGEDDQKAQTVYEQHRRDDLDGDGYDEPYIVTIHKETQRVLRVVASADLETLMVDEDEEGQYISKAMHEPMYVRYIFMPDPEGKIYGLGFGKLLESIGSSINTVLNQILDAAHLQNGGGGFLGGNVDFGKRREMRTSPGKWQQLNATGQDIRQAIVPHNWPGPSPVLFQALGLLVEMGKEIGSVKDVLTGQASANQPVGTTMALIEQGLQQFTAIYKRVFRSLRDEYKLLYRLNSLYLPDEHYFQIMDNEKAVARTDYVIGDYDVAPVSDPTAVTTMQKMAKVEFAMQFKGQPHMNDAAIDKRALAAASIEDVDEFFAKPDPAVAQMQEQMAQLDLAMKQMEVETMRTKATLQQGQTIKAVADAESKETMTDIAEAEAVIGALFKGDQAAGFQDDNHDGVPDSTPKQAVPTAV